MTLSVLALGLLLGVRHAIESDHLAAVAALDPARRGLPNALRLGAWWGLGHTLTLLGFGALALALDWIIPAGLAAGLEGVVGLMLILLGGDLLRRLRRDHIRFSVHRHADGHRHWHALREPEHGAGRHRHRTLPLATRLRALLVGMVHGLAGTAALLLLTLETLREPLQGLAYIAVFGLGSILGMSLLSLIIAVPLGYTGRHLRGAHVALQTAIGLWTLGLGASLAYAHLGPAFA